MWIIKSCLTKIITIFFPPNCYNCRKEGFTLCSTCLKCCKKSIDSPALYIKSIYSFHDPLIKKVVHAIKYFHRRDLIEPLTQTLANEIKGYISTLNIDTSNLVLVPIPMPRLRKYMRGYNQAELIALELSKQCSLPVKTNILTRKYSPKRQVTTKTKSERLQNQRNSFETISSVKNMSIILVDDVTTTGATLTEARKILLKAGAKSVFAVTIAH